jgi:thioesterase domain-containing protein
VAAIRKVQPHGPYLLLGECLGGKLAYAVAQELTRAGESPALLMLLDAPMRPQWANLSFVGKLFARAQQIGNLPTRRLRYYHEQMAEMKWEERVDFVTARIWRRLGKGERGPTTDPRNAARSRYFQQLVDYTPTSPFAQHVPALYSRSNRHHIKEWQRLIPELDVTLVNKPHLEYLSKSADTVAATVRKEVAAVQTQLGQ